MPPIANLPIVVQRGSYRLQLSNLKITDEDLPQLLQRATNELTNAYSQSQAKRANFADVPLIEVTFNKNLITDVSCSAIVNFISQNAHIQSVELLGNGLTDASAPHIVKMITTLPVQRLKVGDNAFTHVGAGIIADALKVSHKGFLQLHIGGNPISDEGVKVLCEACLTSRVEVLGLRDVVFGVEGWEALGTVVASATTGVHDFQLRGNALTLENASAFSNGIRTAALSTNHSYKLTVLSIGNCSIDGPSAKSLFAVLDRANSLNQIDLSSNPFGDEGVTHLVDWLASGHRNHLQWLSLQKAGITAAGIQTMTKSSRCDTVIAALKYLDLSLNVLGETGAAAVATIIQWGMVLEKINLRRCMLAGPRLSEICAAVNYHPTLKEIDFASNFSGSDNAKHWAEIIFATTTLEHVVLTDNAFAAEDTQLIVQSLVAGAGRSLSVLQLGGQSHVPPLGNIITPQSISKLNEALSRNRHQVNDTRRPVANIQFDPVKLRQSLGYAAMPVPVPFPGARRYNGGNQHTNKGGMYHNNSNNHHNNSVVNASNTHPVVVLPFANLQAAGGNFMCFAPQHPQQQPQYFMCTPLAGPAVYGACPSVNNAALAAAAARQANANNNNVHGANVYGGSPQQAPPTYFNHPNMSQPSYTTHISQPQAKTGNNIHQQDGSSFPYHQPQPYNTISSQHPSAANPYQAGGVFAHFSPSIPMPFASTGNMCAPQVPAGAPNTNNNTSPSAAVGDTVFGMGNNRSGFGSNDDVAIASISSTASSLTIERGAGGYIGDSIVGGSSHMQQAKHSNPFGDHNPLNTFAAIVGSLGIDLDHHNDTGAAYFGAGADYII